jgi:hypothetical protein
MVRPSINYLSSGYTEQADYLLFLDCTCLCQKASPPPFGSPYYSIHDT